MNTSITVKVAEESDVEGVEQVIYQTWLDTYPNEAFGITVEDIEERFVERLSEKGLELRKQRMREQSGSETTRVFVAKEHGKVVGMCLALITDTANQLTAIYVLPGHQGKGIGKLLWNEALQFFDNTKDILVELAVYNTKALAFYEALGFKDTGKRFSKEVFKMKSGAVMPEMEMKIERANT